MTTAETVWLLDVDGVLNASSPGWSAAPYKGRAFADVDEYKLRWAPALVTRIKALRATGLVDVVWCTTWCPWADQIERIMGFPGLGRAWVDDKRGWYAREAKRGAAADVLARGKRLVWTDDEAFPYDRSGFPADRALLIAPKPSRGLQPADMDAIEAFVRPIPPMSGGVEPCADTCSAGTVPTTGARRAATPTSGNPA